MLPAPLLRYMGCPRASLATVVGSLPPALRFPVMVAVVVAWATVWVPRGMTMLPNSAGDDVVAAVDAVALDELAGAADELVEAVELEGTIAGVDRVGAVLEDEHAVALDGEVGVDSGDFEGAVAEVFGHGAGGGAEADLEGIGSAVAGAGGGAVGEVFEELGFEIEL